MAIARNILAKELRKNKLQQALLLGLLGVVDGAIALFLYPQAKFALKYKTCA